jgi:hypothetical protein
MKQIAKKNRAVFKAGVTRAIAAAYAGLGLARAQTAH